MELNLYLFWDLIIEYGYNIRKNGKDGLKGWELLKSIIPNTPIKWSEKSRNFYDEFGKLGVNQSESSEEAGMTKDNWERHHYILQHGRIIYKNPEGDLRRLGQIAYNAGQFRRELEKEIYPEEQMRYYIINELNKVTTYIDESVEINGELIEQIKEAINESKKGGRKKVKKTGGNTTINNYLDNYINLLK